MFNVNKVQQEQRSHLLADNDDDNDTHYQEMQPVQGSVQYVDDETTKHEDNKILPCCSWKCCCLSTAFIFCLFMLIIVVLLSYVFIAVAPQFAQDTLDHATMDVINGSIYNATNSSITLDTTVLVSNAGMVNGVLSSHTTTVSVDGIEIGTMPMPTLNTIANENVIISLTSVLSITNKAQFQKTCKGLLENADQTWHLSGRDVTLTVDTGLMKTDFTVSVEKDLVLKGAKFSNFIASDMNVNAATNTTVESVSNLNFISESVFEFQLPNTLMNVYYNDIYIGYAPLNGMSMSPGLNTILDQSIVIERTDSNQGTLNTFFSNYLHGTDQDVFMKGPIPSEAKGYGSLVIDGIFEQTVNTVGYQHGDLAFGGLLTSGSQMGWSVDGDTVRGAYSNFLNPLNVPVRIAKVEALVSMPVTLEYHVKLVSYAVERDCVATEFAQLSTGRGIWKDDPDKTWVDVSANERVTYFAISDPPEGQFEGNCMYTYPFDCCFATLGAAYACYLNPGIQTAPSTGQLTTDYMTLRLDANVTLLVDGKFEMVTTTSQPFLPLYFGREVYNGYTQDLKLSCTDFTFKM